MNVLHVTPYMHPKAGGPVVVVDRLCRELTAAGWDATVLTTDAYSEGTEVAAWGLENRPYRLRVHPSHSMPFAPHRAASASLASDLAHIVSSFDIVHVHTLWTHASAEALRATRWARVPTIVMPHGMLDPHSLTRHAWRKLVYGRLVEFPRLRRARAMAYTTSEEQRLAESAVPRLPNGFVVPLGTDDPPPVSRAEASRRFFGTLPHLASKRLIVHFGRIHPKKGLDLLVPAFAEVLAKVPDAHLLLVGPEEGNYLKTVRELARRRRVENRMTHVPMLHGDAKWQALAAATVFALPSYQENFGIAVAEAARMGLPLVISNRVNLWPDVEHAGAGLVVECNEDSVAAALISLLTNPDRCRRLGEAAERLARERFTWSNAGRATLEMYESILREFGRTAAARGLPAVQPIPIP